MGKSLDEFVIDEKLNIDGFLVYKVHPVKDYIWKCPKCGCHYVKQNGFYTKEVRDIPQHGKPVTLIIRAHTFKCTKCGKGTRAPLINIPYRARLTNRLRSAILNDYSGNMTATQVASNYNVSEGLVRQLAKKRVF